MGSNSAATPGTPSSAKRKEIYRYQAPWPIFSMNWSVTPTKRFRLAIGSFIEEYNNKVRLPLTFVIPFFLVLAQFHTLKSCK